MTDATPSGVRHAPRTPAEYTPIDRRTVLISGLAARGATRKMVRLVDDR